ncbi:potassium channel protein [Halobacteriales archaeon QS_4_69_31]|nr:MAG: potassium channel protein [Halobacteriales archaeon QS_4_69_31]
MSEDGRVEYEPRSVKALLREMKDTAELLIDLSYSSVLFDDTELAGEVLELEQRMDVLEMQAWMALVMAGRSPNEAESLAPVFGIVGAAEKISDAAGDIAKVVREDIGLPAALRRSLPEAVETLARAAVAPESAYAGRTLGEVDLETETGVRVIAVRRDREWIHSPDRETRLAAGDVAVCRGPEDAVETVYETLTGDAFERPPPDAADIADLDRAVESVVLMKTISELAVDLAYGSVLFDDADLATEVRELEIEVDALQSRFEAWTLRAAAAVDDPVSLRGLVHIGTSTEVISDAAVEISDGVLRGISGHPVVAAAVGESDEIIARVVLDGGVLVGGTLADLDASDAAGVTVIAVRRAGEDDGTDRSEWVLSPGPGTDLRAGDHLIAKGTRTAVARLEELAT